MDNMNSLNQPESLNEKAFGDNGNPTQALGANETAPGVQIHNSAYESAGGFNQANIPIGGEAREPEFRPYGSSPIPMGNASFAPVSPDGPAASKKSAKKEKRGGAGRVAAIAICCSLIGGLAGGAGGYLISSRVNTQQSGVVSDAGNVSSLYEGERQEVIIDINHIDTSKIMSQAEVYAKNVNAVVGISTSITTNYWGYTTTSAASGSGFVLTDDGYILTNFHVIEDANSIKVSFYDGTELDAQLIGYDESNDIAVLKVEAENLQTVILGSSEELNVGDQVMAIGNPLGELTFSLTSGYVSALDREVTLSSNLTMNLIQTDCAINSGNSGGPLFNLYGEVVGITNAKYSSSSMSEATIDNIGFAIPIDDIKSIVMSIIEKGYVSKPYIGVSVIDVSEETQVYGLPAGASIQLIEDGSPAEKAGLEINDIITGVNGKTIEGSGELVSAIAELSPGDTAELTVYRMGSTITVNLTIGEKIQSAIDNSESSQSQEQSQQGQQGQNDDGGRGSFGSPFDWFFGN